MLLKCTSVDRIGPIWPWVHLKEWMGINQSEGRIASTDQSQILKLSWHPPLVTGDTVTWSWSLGMTLVQDTVVCNNLFAGTHILICQTQIRLDHLEQCYPTEIKHYNRWSTIFTRMVDPRPWSKEWYTFWTDLAGK